MKDQWQHLRDALGDGATVVAANFVRDLLAERDALRADAERTARNRDMWKGQCGRQARQLEALRMTDERRTDLLASALYIAARDDDTAVLDGDAADRISEMLCDMSGVDLDAAIADRSKGEGE